MVSNSSIDMLAGLPGSGSFKTPPCFCAKAVLPVSSASSNVPVATRPRKDHIIVSSSPCCEIVRRFNGLAVGLWPFGHTSLLGAQLHSWSRSLAHGGWSAHYAPRRCAPSRTASSILLDREEQLWHGLIEAPADEMRDAYCKERPADAGVVFATEDRPALTLKPKGGRLGLVSGKPARHPGDRRDHR